jgi:transcriptional antiterminator RfaH
VIRLLTAGGEGPLHVPDAVVDGIRAREVGGLVELPRRDAFKPGDKVRIVAGAFTGHRGLYAEMRPHERVVVLLALLGGQQRVELPAADVEEIKSVERLT